MTDWTIILVAPRDLIPAHRHRSSSRAFYNRSLCVQLKNVPYETRVVYPLVYAATGRLVRQADGERIQRGATSTGGAHARTLHTFLTAGGGIQIASSADENRDRPKLAGERRRRRRESNEESERTSERAKDGKRGAQLLSSSSGSNVGRERVRERERERRREGAGIFVRVFSSLALP